MSMSWPDATDRSAAPHVNGYKEPGAGRRPEAESAVPPRRPAPAPTAAHRLTS